LWGTLGTLGTLEDRIGAVSNEAGAICPVDKDCGSCQRSIAPASAGQLPVHVEPVALSA